MAAVRKLSCAIGHDTRHKSDHFARLCAEIMTAAGFTVYFLKAVSIDAGVVVHRAREEMFVRHHGDGQPQSAERQRGESLLVDGRADSSAAR